METSVDRTAVLSADGRPSPLVLQMQHCKAAVSVNVWQPHVCTTGEPSHHQRRYVGGRGGHWVRRESNRAFLGRDQGCVGEEGMDLAANSWRRYEDFHR